MRDLCLAGEPEGWRGFIGQYAALVRHLGQHYFAELPADDFLREVFREAHANDAALLRGFTGSSEGEFLLCLRPFVLERGRRRRREPPTAPLVLEKLWELLQQFQPLQRELILLRFRGYTPEEITRIHRFEPETTEKVLAAVTEKARGQLGLAFRDDLPALDHEALFAEIERQRTDQCVPDKTYVRIVDGQITWREKEDVEPHIDACLYCLARFAEYREVSYFLHKLPAIEPAVARELAAALGLPPAEEDKPRGLARYLSWLGRRPRSESN